MFCKNCKAFEMKYSYHKENTKKFRKVYLLVKSPKACKKAGKTGKIQKKPNYWGIVHT